MPRKNDPTKSKKFDHPADMAGAYAKTAEPKSPKHPKKTDAKARPELGAKEPGKSPARGKR